MGGKLNRRTVLNHMAGIGVAGFTAPAWAVSWELYTIGLSMYSLRFLFKDGMLTALDYPAFARNTFGITALDVWDGGLPANRKNDPAFYKELKQSADEAGTYFFMLMAGAVNALGTTSEDRKAQAALFYTPVNNAALLGCKYLRVFLKAPESERSVAISKSVETLVPLADYAMRKNIILLIEPGASEWAKQGDFLAELARQANHPNLRLMPDFGKMKDHDLYGGTQAMMPYTEVVSAKSHDFDAAGNEINFDYARLMKTIVDSGFQGIVAIEYEGKELPPVEGVRATQKLLERLREELSN